jgi:hypothetical protein
MNFHYPWCRILNKKIIGGTAGSGTGMRIGRRIVFFLNLDKFCYLWVPYVKNEEKTSKKLKNTEGNGSTMFSGRRILIVVLFESVDIWVTDKENF